MIDVNKFLNNIFNEGLVDTDITDTEMVDTTKADDIDFEDSLSDVVQQSGDYDISDLSDSCKCGSFMGVCKESVVDVNGEKYRVQVSVTKL